MNSSPKSPGPSSSPLTAQTPPSRLRPKPKGPASAPLGFGAKVEPKTPTLERRASRKWGGGGTTTTAAAPAPAPAAAPAAAAALAPARGGLGGAWGRSTHTGGGGGVRGGLGAGVSAARRDILLAEAKREQHAAAVETHTVAKASANDAWKAKRYAECLDHLDASLGVNGDCDVLHRYRSRAYNHLGKYDSAKRDADKAVALNPRSAPNLLVQGQCLQQVKKNSESAAALLGATRLGGLGTPWWWLF